MQKPCKYRYWTDKYRWKRNYQSTNNCKFFQYHFLTWADKITNNIKNDKTSLNCNNPTHTLFIRTLSSSVQIWNENKQHTKNRKNYQNIEIQNSHGYYGIPMRILKVSTLFVTSPLTYICNKSFLFDIFPSRLKFSEIKPIY